MKGVNITLDCNGHKVIGPGIPLGERTKEYFGIYANGKKKIVVQNCDVYGYDRGLYFESVKNSTVTNSHFYNNTRYGANLARSGSFSNVWDGNTFHDNGDEGIHISGPFKPPTSKILANTFTNSAADNNATEGWYLLNAKYVQLDLNTATDNGTAGAYIKNSSHNTIQRMTLTRNTLHLIGNSDANNIDRVTVVGEQVKLQSDTEVTPVTYPNSSAFNLICVRYSTVNSEPDVAFQLNNVVSGGNTFTNSAAFLIVASPPKDHVKAFNNSSGDTFTLLYVEPTPRRKITQDTSSVTVTDTSTAPACY